MPITRNIATRTITGLSTDAKPILGTTDVGWLYYEIDTEIKYEWYGSAWTKKPNTSDFFFEIATGTIAKHTSVSVAGHNSNIGSTEESIWDYEGIYTYSTIADITQIASNNAADTETIRLKGLDINYVE